MDEGRRKTVVSVSGLKKEVEEAFRGEKAGKVDEERTPPTCHTPTPLLSLAHPNSGRTISVSTGLGGIGLQSQELLEKFGGIQ